MDPKMKLEKGTISEQIRLPYQNLIGSPMFLAFDTRPDIAYSISYLSQFNYRYSQAHWKAGNMFYNISREQFISLSLLFEKTIKLLVGLTGIDWESSTSNRKSYFGYAKYTYANVTISWASRKQKSVLLSTVEVEYFSIIEATKETLHLKQLIQDMEDYQREDISILNDSQAAQRIESNPVVSDKSKHIIIKLLFVQEKI